MSSFRCTLLCTLLLAVLACGCRGGCSGTGGKVSEDRLTQATYETAVQTVDQLEQRRRQGQDVGEACRVARALFVKELQQVADDRASELLDRLRGVCPPAGTEAPPPATKHQGPASGQAPPAGAAPPSRPGEPGKGAASR